VKIVRASLIPFSLPFVRPVETARTTHHKREGILLEIADSNNLRGYGEAAPLEGFQTESLLEARTALIQFLPVLLQQRKYSSIQKKIKKFHADFPGASTALSAIDTALCDLYSRQQGCSVATLLAEQFKTSTTESLQVNCLLHAQDLEEIIIQAKEKLCEGFQTFKIKTGVQSIQKDIDRIIAVRKALGENVKIRLDANEAWSYEEADRVLQVLSPMSIEYIEQPLAAEDFAGCVRLRSRHKIPLAADEAACSVDDIRKVLKQQAADLIILKPAATGGPHISMRMGLLAAQRVIPCVTTTLMDGAVGRAMATHVAAALPPVCGSYACGLATGSLFKQDLADGLKIEDGQISLNSVQGLGIDIDLVKLAKVASGETVEFLA